MEISELLITIIEEAEAEISHSELRARRHLDYVKFLLKNIFGHYVEDVECNEEDLDLIKQKYLETHRGLGLK